MKPIHIVLVVFVSVFVTALLVLLFVILLHRKTEYEAILLPPYTRVPQVLAVGTAWSPTQQLEKPQFVDYLVPYPTAIRDKGGSLGYFHHSLTVQWNGWRQTGFVGMFQPDVPEHARATTHDLMLVPLVAPNEKGPIQFGHVDVFPGLVQYYHNIPPVLSRSGAESRDHGVDLLMGLLENKSFTKESLRMYVGYRVSIPNQEKPGSYWLAHEENVPHTHDCVRAFHTAYMWSSEFTAGRQYIMFPVPQDVNDLTQGQHLRFIPFQMDPPKFEKSFEIDLPTSTRVIRTTAFGNTLVLLCWDHYQKISRLLQYSYDDSIHSFTSQTEIPAPANNDATCAHNILHLTAQHFVVGNGNTDFAVYRRTSPTSYTWFLAQDIALLATETILDVAVSDDGLILAALAETDTEIVLYVWRWNLTTMTYQIDADEPFRYAYTRPTQFKLEEHSLALHMSLDHRVVQILVLEDGGLHVFQWSF